MARAVSKIPWPLENLVSHELRASVVDCGGPLPPWRRGLAVEKRRRAAAVQNLAEFFSGLSRFRPQFY